MLDPDANAELFEGLLDAFYSTTTEFSDESSLLQLCLLDGDGNVRTPLALLDESAEPVGLLRTFAIAGLMGRYSATWGAFYWASPATEGKRVVVAISSQAAALAVNKPGWQAIAIVVDPTNPQDQVTADEPPPFLTDIAMQLNMGLWMTQKEGFTTLDLPVGDELLALSALADMASASFSEEDLANPSFQMAAFTAEEGKPSVIQLPGVPDDNPDGHTYFVVPSILLNFGAHSAAISSVVTRNEDGVDGTMTFAVSGSGSGIMRVWFPDFDPDSGLQEAVGPQVTALRYALARNSK